MIKTIGYGAQHSFSRLRPFAFEREEAGADEIEIERDVLEPGSEEAFARQAGEDG